MSIPLTIKVGPAVLADGGENELRGGKSGEGIFQQLHGPYFEQTYRNKMFSASNQAAQAVSIALATTYTGILLYNPVGSGVNLSLSFVKFALTVAPAAIASIGLISGYAATGGVTAQTTPLTVRSNMVGNVGSAAIALAAATIVTPVWHLHLVDGFTAAALPAPSPLNDIRGALQIPPGGFIAVGALTAVTGMGTLMWEEVPV